MSKVDQILISGYSSFDHMLHLQSFPEVGRTALIENASCRQIYWGGCSVNISVALQRLGKNALPILRVGEDFESSGFKAFLQKEKIETDAFQRIPGENNPSSFLLHLPNGEHITTFYPGAMDERYAQPVSDEYFTSNAAVLLTVAAYSDNRYILESAIKKGAPVYFGMKGDYKAFPKALLTRILHEAEIVFMNETEERQLKEFLELENIQALFRRGKCETIVVTKGAQGADYFSKQGEEGSVSSVRVENPIDPTGCGDALIAGFLYGAMENQSIRKCCQLGCTLASFVIEKEGCCTNLPNETTLKKRCKEAFTG